MDTLDLVHVALLSCGASARIYKRGDAYIPQVVSKCGKLIISCEQYPATESLLEATRWCLQNIDSVIVNDLTTEVYKRIAEIEEVALETLKGGDV